MTTIRDTTPSDERSRLFVWLDSQVHREAKSLVVLSADRTLRNLVERLLREWVAAQRAAA